MLRLIGTGVDRLPGRSALRTSAHRSAPITVASARRNASRVRWGKPFHLLGSGVAAVARNVAVPTVSAPTAAVTSTEIRDAWKASQPLRELHGASHQGVAVNSRRVDGELAVLVPPLGDGGGQRDATIVVVRHLDLDGRAPESPSAMVSPAVVTLMAPSAVAGRGEVSAVATAMPNTATNTNALIRTMPHRPARSHVAGRPYRQRSGPAPDRVAATPTRPGSAGGVGQRTVPRGGRLAQIGPVGLGEGDLLVPLRRARRRAPPPGPGPGGTGVDQAVMMPPPSTGRASRSSGEVPASARARMGRRGRGSRLAVRRASAR